LDGGIPSGFDANAKLTGQLRNASDEGAPG
jgi:hypothetical protein